MKGCGRIVLFKDLGKNSGAAEKGKSAREFGVFPWECRLKALLGHILVVGVTRILGVDIVFSKKLREAEDSSRETILGQHGTLDTA